MENFYLIFVFALVFIGLFYLNIRLNTKVSTLKANYQEALKGADKSIALEKGRAYFTALRIQQAFPKLPVQNMNDELAIANDIATMDKTIK